MTPNSTSLLASLGTSIRDISFYRKNHYEYLQYPALIVSHKIEVKNCKFAGYNYCVGLTPVYIDSLLFESISQYDCKNLLVCCDYNGNVIEDRTFNGDWFYFSNSDFGFDENIVYGGLKSTVSILFNNCLHGIIALPKIHRYVVEVSTILYLHCHFENRQPCIKFIDQMMLFIKENSDRCHYYNGKWNKKDLAIGISSIILGSIAKYFITLI